MDAPFPAGEGRDSSMESAPMQHVRPIPQDRPRAVGTGLSGFMARAGRVQMFCILGTAFSLLLMVCHMAGLGL